MPSCKLRLICLVNKRKLIRIYKNSTNMYHISFVIKKKLSIATEFHKLIIIAFDFSKKKRKLFDSSTLHNPPRQCNDSSYTSCKMISMDITLCYVCLSIQIFSINVGCLLSPLFQKRSNRRTHLGEEKQNSYAQGLTQHPTPSPK